MKSQIEEQATIAAALDLYTYLDMQDADYDNLTLGKIMYTIEQEGPAMSKEERECYDRLEAIIEKNSSVENMTLIHQSSIEGGIDTKLLNAVAFQDPTTGDIYVCYRGTGDGKWVDNGVGLSTEESLMQKMAVEYFDRVVESEHLADGGKRGNLYVSGHSKGGNEAQVVTMESEYRYLIDRCYNIDGQGVSNQALEAYQQQLDYEYQVDKIILICGENDFVHDLGNGIATPDHTYFLETPAAFGITDYHKLPLLFDESGNLNPEAANGQGAIGILAKKLSKQLMEMDDEDIRDCSVTLMSILEMTMKYDEQIGGEYLLGTGDVSSYTPEECIGFLANGLPLIARTLLGTEEGRELVWTLLVKAMAEQFRKHGIAGVWGMLYLIGILCIALLPIVREVVKIAKILEWIFDFVDTVKEWSETMKVFWQEMRSITIQTLYDAWNWLNEHLNPGMIEAGAHPYVKVDTGEMLEHADSLKRLAERMQQLDRELDELYRHAEITELWDILQADLLLDNSRKLKQIEQYLRETADDFERTEREIGQIAADFGV